MAVIPAVINNDVSRNNGVRQIVWPALTQTNNVGAPVQLAEWSGKTFQLVGSFGTVVALVLLEGSNDLDPASATWSALTSWQGTVLSTSVPVFMTSRDMPLWVRPRLTLGDGTSSVTVTMVVHRQDMAAMS